MSVLAGLMTDGVLGIGKQRETAVQRDKPPSGHSDILGGGGVDQDWAGTVLLKVLLRWMPSQLSPLAIVAAVRADDDHDNNGGLDKQ